MACLSGLGTLPRTLPLIVKDKDSTLKVFKLERGRPKSLGCDPDRETGSTGSSQLGSGGQTHRKAGTVKQPSKQDNPVKATQFLPSSVRSSPERVRSQSRSRDHSGKARRRTWTLTSDSDVLSDLSDDVTSHPGCWLILVAVEGVKTLALIDTGASVMMMDRPLYEKIQKKVTAFASSDV